MITPSKGTHYADWSTIDWLSDHARDRLRHQMIVEQRKDSLWKRFVAYHDALSGWSVIDLHKRSQFSPLHKR